MPALRAQCVPDGAGGSPLGPERTRDRTSPLWAGIDASDPRDWCGLCTRAMRGGVYQVKAVDAMCGVHNGTRRG